MSTVKLSEIINYLDELAPPVYQENYDNSGLICGNANLDLTGVMVTVDCTEQVVDEAIAAQCNLIVAHHPIIFKGLKSLTGKNYVERTVIKAIQNNVAIFAIHTNLDNVLTGVNRKICEKIGLVNCSILAPKRRVLSKLVTFIPHESVDKVVRALHEAGAGNIGNYEQCSFRIQGTGTFLPNEKAKPHSGSVNKIEHVAETRVEMIFPSVLESRVLQALKCSHPYEEVAFYLNVLDNEFQDVGSGMIGELASPEQTGKFLTRIKGIFGSNLIRHTQPVKDQIGKVAVCGGAGSFLLPLAKSARADIFISADFKYHEFFDAEKEIIIADVGHYESEQFTKELLMENLTRKFPTFAVNFSKTDTNPISYL
ncbi:MAG: Nif3-like dinuclear metal center hexameric protein [Flammeovirgaceae bacterium]|nr:Nif3-like dinuclear metal center hexameric protein [Flammeovirgaceae bacterium]